MKGIIVLHRIHRSFILQCVSLLLSLYDRTVLFVQRTVKLYLLLDALIYIYIYICDEFADWHNREPKLRGEWFAMRVSYSNISRWFVTSVKRRSFVRMCVINGFRLRTLFRRYFLRATTVESERPWVCVRGRETSWERLSSRPLHFDCQSVIFGCLSMTARRESPIVA